MNIKKIDLHDITIFPNALYMTDYFVLTYQKLTSAQSRYLHFHNTYELEFLTEGRVVTRINASKYDCSAGAFWMVFPNNFHQVEIVSDYAVILSLKFTDKAVLPEISAKLQKLVAGIITSMETDELESFIDDVDRALSTLVNLNNDLYESVIIKCLMSQILVKILDREIYNDASSSDGHSFHDALYESIKYVRDNFTQKLSRDDVAAKFGFSCSYYSMIFKKCTGKSFTDFVLSEKLDFAYYLLVSTKMTVKEISEESGFESPAYFSKIFKKNYGISPTCVRNESTK